MRKRPTKLRAMRSKEDLKQEWLREENCAQIHGWDFSHIERRYEQGELPWDYRAVVKEILKPEYRILDMDTGGGEFLLSLGHPHEKIGATEGYPPNVALCKEKLISMGIDFRAAKAGGRIPFEDGNFDMVLNRHGSFDAEELYRVLKPGGLFLTQQVGEDNDRELVELLLPGTPKPYPGWNEVSVAEQLKESGFEILRTEEALCPIRFYDIGALVWFARIIEWEFPGFSVASCLDRLFEAQERLEKQGCVEGRAHRFLVVARKPCDGR